VHSRGGPPSVRIGSGAFRGRKLLPPVGRRTRPITGLAKKSLFGILTGRLDDATVLDLYCGAGTLGLEALSCGARRCFFAERDPETVQRLRRNIDACGVRESSVVWQGDGERRLTHWLEELDAPADLVFVDPPYASARQWSWPAAVERIFAPLAERLAEDGQVILRLPGDSPPPETLGPLVRLRIREYGDMTIAFYARAEKT
jgi:16S rRNA (guanine966-N2)-methyltransferase